MKHGRRIAAVAVGIVLTLLRHWLRTRRDSRVPQPPVDALARETAERANLGKV